MSARSSSDKRSRVDVASEDAWEARAALAGQVSGGQMRRFAWMWAVALVLGLAAAPFAAAQDVDPLRRTPVVVAAERATPAVVTIRTQVEQRSPFFLGGARRGASEGSGVIIDPDGVVLTNAHVVDGALQVDVKLTDGREFQADVVALDRELDLAVLRIAGVSGLPMIALGDSAKLMLGEPAIAIGNPLGLGLTVSTGVVASTGRDVTAGDGPRQTYIQTDAAINPGNSGGALVNIHGELIGINTFVASTAEGIGFAIPVNRARKIAEDLLMFGTVQVPWLGADLDDVMVRGHGPAARVVRLMREGPSARAGVRPGDLVSRIDGHDVGSRADLNARLAELRAGDSVTLGVLRNGAEVDIRVRTQETDEELGRRVLQGVLRVRLEQNGGALEATSVESGGSWARAQLRVGDVLLGIDGRRVGTLDEVIQAIQAAKARHRPSALFIVGRGPYKGTVEVGI